jgi:hypothetical protein
MTEKQTLDREAQNAPQGAVNLTATSPSDVQAGEQGLGNTDTHTDITASDATVQEIDAQASSSGSPTAAQPVTRKGTDSRGSIVIEGESLRAEVVLESNKPKNPVRLVQKDLGAVLLLDECNLVAQKQRKQLVSQLPSDAQAEGEQLLVSLATTVLAARETASLQPEKQINEARTPSFNIPDPSPYQVEGDALLDDLAAWFSKYVYMPPGAPDALAGWTVLTWFVNEVYFAPLLTILSPTKGCGKTLLLDLLEHVVYRANRTSGVGATSAVVFRLNERFHPTFLIDEAERLADRRGSRDLIEMLNLGYRRGAKVLRCGDRKGQFEVEEFDAFGFRAVAAIGHVWDTLLDRAIQIFLQKKRRNLELAGYYPPEAQAEGVAIARRIRRWVDDHGADVIDALAGTPRPKWLSDRSCDNWEGHFAIGMVAGGGWLERMLEAATNLQSAAKDDGDPAERLLHDLQEVFESEGKPEVIQSGGLVQKLNAIETSPWGDSGNEGISMHRVARMLRRFGRGPRQGRTQEGKVVRGYWLSDWVDVFARYAAETGTSATTGTDANARTTVPPVPV